MTDTRDDAPDNAVLVFSRALRTRSLVVAAGTLVAVGVALFVLFGILQRVATARGEVDRARGELQGIQQELASAKLNRDSLVAEIQEKTELLEKQKLELVSSNQQLGEVSTLLNEPPRDGLAKRIQKVVSLAPSAKAALATKAPSASAVPLERVSSVRMSLTPTSDVFKERPVYQVRVWVELPKDRAADVLKVEYFFDHPSFVPKLMTAFEGDTGFRITYRGYGCVPSTATLVGVDGSKHPLPFDMCALWVGARPATKTAKE
jgi:hypothetical protein